MLSVLLSLCVCSVSASGSLTDWFFGGPYATDFYHPAGGNSAVVDVKAGDVYRRFVFPNNSNVVVGFDNGQFIMMWTASEVSDVAYNYYNYTPDVGFDVHDYEYVKPIVSSSGNVYLGEIRFPLPVDGAITNVSVDNENDPNGIIKTLPFPDANIAEEHKTQGMISQLIQNIKDWFSNLIESMGNFFTELGNKISSGFTALGDKIKGFFTQLVEDIKGLFIPSDGFFDEFSKKFETWAREHFGFLFETIEIIDTTLTKLINFSPSDSASITLPKTSFSIHGKEYVLWNSITYNFNSLLNEVPALNTLHSIYFTVVYALFFYLLYRLGEKSYNDIFGGRD